MQYELKKLEELCDSLDPKNEAEYPLSADLPAIREQIELECARVRESLNKVIFTQAKENLTERYIQFHQTGIIQLADQLQSYFSSRNQAEKQVITGFFITRLFDLLSYIERYFSKYFNPDARIPDAYRLVALKQLGGTVSFVLSLVMERLSSPSLKACLSDYLRSFSEDRFPEGLSFRDLIYLKSFLNETEQLFRAKEVTYWDARLSASLVYLNFNHLGFFTYYQDLIRSELENAVTRDQYLVVLSGHLAQLKGQQSKPAYSYRPAWPNIKTMLETWLNDEVTMTALQRVKGTVPAAAEQGGSDKLVLNLSVAQIACFTHLLYEENCYATPSVTDILKFTARHYQSKRQDHISTGSLSKEYYGISQVTAAVVRDLLQKMIARINKSYFPLWVAACAAGFGWSGI